MIALDFLVIEWTDQAQAIGSILAIPGAFAAFWVLFQRDKEKKEAVRQLAAQTKELGAHTTELKAQAAEATKQTGHLADQVTQLGQQVFQLERIHEAIAEGIRIMAKSEELNNHVHRIKIRPQFDFEFSMLKPGHSEAEIRLLNRGGTARKLSVKNLSAEDAIINLPESVASGDTMRVTWLAPRKMNGFAPNIELHFEDDEGNRYTQRLFMELGKHSMTEPRLME